MAFAETFRGKRVLLTGHTGFKGAWLAEWLLALGAEVTGLALAPATDSRLFVQLDLSRRVIHREGDIRTFETVRDVVAALRPEFIFHLAAQSLVRRSYEIPVETYATNVLGTVHVLEAARQAKSPCTIVAVTTDKAYENSEWLHSYREVDPMGGHDPYSSSKGMAELALSAYRRSFFSHDGGNILLASARAGNVIGGGDWARDRIIPDCIRSLQSGAVIPVRNRIATRPWQHVLEPLSGYLQLAALLHQSALANEKQMTRALASPFNFGPSLDSNRSVLDLVREVVKHWPGQWADQSDPAAVHEASRLNLATDKAHHLLGWRPVWNFEEAVAQTVGWYRTCHSDPARARELTAQQIVRYESDARARNVAWAG